VAVPLRQRLGWAAGAMCMSLALYARTAARYGYQPGLRVCLLLAYVSAVVGYYGCTWRRR